MHEAEPLLDPGAAGAARGLWRNADRESGRGSRQCGGRAVDLSTPLQIRPVEGRDWALDLAPGRILYQPEGGKQMPFYPVSPRLEQAAAVYPTQTPDGEAVTITLRPAQCAEGSTLAAEVRIGAATLKGCAHKMTVEQVHREMYNEALALPYDAGNNASSD
jgi:uncharacterized membrane protein